MKYLKIILLILVITTALFSCQEPNEETEILNQIFPELTKVMRLTIIEPIDYPPPLPNSIFPDYFNRERLSDTCINRQDLMNYRSSLEEYNKYLQDYYFNNYAFRLDSINTVIGIVDSLGYCMACSLEDEMPIQYSDIMENMNASDITPKVLNLKKITNTGFFKLKRTSQIGWYPKIDFDEFVGVERDYYLSGVLSISRIHFNKSKTYGLFSCTKFMDHREPYPLLIGIKKTGEEWHIEKTVLGI